MIKIRQQIKNKTTEEKIRQQIKNKTTEEK